MIRRARRSSRSRDVDQLSADGAGTRFAVARSGQAAGSAQQVVGLGIRVGHAGDPIRGRFGDR